jgi:BMFP domain-containing protein YqiC
MKNSSLANISNLNSDNLKDEINSFKNNFTNKSQYFICEQDIIGLIMNKYLDIIENFISINLRKFKKNFIIKIYKLIKKRSIDTSNLLSKFDLLEKKFDNQQLILERSFEQNSKLQQEINNINNKIVNKYEQPELNYENEKPQVIGHNSNTKVDFYQEENLRLGSELVETKKKFEILKNEIEKYENQISNLITKINSVNDVINNSNVLTNVFENEIQPKVNILDPQNIQKKDKVDLNDQIKAIFSKKI